MQVAQKLSSGRVRLIQYFPCSNIIIHSLRYGDDFPVRFVPKKCKPTDFLPGTLEKIDILAARALSGEELFHPNDSKWSQE